MRVPSFCGTPNARTREKYATTAAITNKLFRARTLQKIEEKPLSDVDELHEEEDTVTSPAGPRRRLSLCTR